MGVWSGIEANLSDKSRRVPKHRDSMPTTDCMEPQIGNDETTMIAGEGEAMAKRRRLVFL